MTDPFADLDERALRARASLHAATSQRAVPVFAPARTRVPRRLVPLLTAAAVVVVVAVAALSASRSAPVTPGGVTTIPAGERPVAVATDGRTAWVADAGRGEVLAIDLTTRRPRWHVPAGSQPVAVAYGLGAIWVVDGGGASLLKLDPATGRRLAQGRTSLDPVDLTVAYGAVWVLSAGNQTLDRYDATTVAQSMSAVLGARATALTFSGDSLWVSAADGLRRVDPRTLAVTSVPLQGPRAIAAGGGTTLWVARADGTLVAVDGTTGTLRGPAVALSAPVRALAVSAGAAYVATGDGTVHRFITPGTRGSEVASVGTPLDALVATDHLVAGLVTSTAQLLVTEVTP
jgi:DNA-binding beta-propeller fold protein YncE